MQAYKARKFGPWLDEARDPLIPGVLQELVEPILGDAENVDAEAIVIKEEWWVQHRPLDQCCLLQYLAVGAREALAIIIPHEALPEVKKVWLLDEDALEVHEGGEQLVEARVETGMVSSKTESDHWLRSRSFPPKSASRLSPQLANMVFRHGCDCDGVQGGWPKGLSDDLLFGVQVHGEASEPCPARFNGLEKKPKQIHFWEDPCRAKAKPCLVAHFNQHGATLEAKCSSFWFIIGLLVGVCRSLETKKLRKSDTYNPLLDAVAETVALLSLPLVSLSRACVL